MRVLAGELWRHEGGAANRRARDVRAGAASRQGAARPVRATERGREMRRARPRRAESRCELAREISLGRKYYEGCDELLEAVASPRPFLHPAPRPSCVPRVGGGSSSRRRPTCTARSRCWPAPQRARARWTSSCCPRPSPSAGWRRRPRSPACAARRWSRQRPWPAGSFLLARTAFFFIGGPRGGAGLAVLREHGPRGVPRVGLEGGRALV